MLVPLLLLCGNLIEARLPPSKHVAIIVFERANYNEVVGNPIMNFFNTRRIQGSLGTNYFGLTTTSTLGNYIGLTTYPTDGNLLIDDDSAPRPYLSEVDNIVRRMKAENLLYKSYAPRVQTGNVNPLFPYKPQTDPFSYFNDSKTFTGENPFGTFTDLVNDLNTNNMPHLSFIAPADIICATCGDCNSLATCKLSEDNFLQSFIPRILATPGFRQDGLVVVLWSRGTSDNTNGGGKVPFLLLGPNVKPNYQSSKSYSHNDTLAMVSEALSLSGFSDSPMSEFFKPLLPTPKSTKVVFVMLSNAVTNMFEQTLYQIAMPFLNCLRATGALSTNYFATSKVAIGDYFTALTQRFVTQDSAFAGSVSIGNLVESLDAAGLSWKSYAEDRPTVSDHNEAGYVRFRDPVSYLTSTGAGPNGAKLASSAAFDADLANDALPTFSILLPNSTNNGACTTGTLDCLKRMDNFLKAKLHPLINHPSFLENGLLVFWWERTIDVSIFTDNRLFREDGFSRGGGQVPLVLYGPKVKNNFASSNAYNHRDTHIMLAEALRLPKYAASSMTEFFKPLETFAPTTKQPTKAPTTRAPASVRPTRSPTIRPTRKPTSTPTLKPTRAPTNVPTFRPTPIGVTARPTRRPTKSPVTKGPTTAKPSRMPTEKPTRRPSKQPSFKATKGPTTHKPTKSPTTSRPTTAKPTSRPTASICKV